MTNPTKNLIALTALCSMLGCTKKDGGTTTSNSVAYTIVGLADVQVTQYRDTNFAIPVGLNYVSGNQETVTLKVDEVPANCTVTPSSVSGIPTFATLLNFHVQALTSGNLPVKVSVTTSSGSIKTFTFNLVSAANSYCRDLYLDSFMVVDSMVFKTSGTLIGVTQSTMTGRPVTYNANKILLGYDTLNIDCSNSIVTTDSVRYPNGNYHTRGTGTRTNDKIEYQYTYYQWDAPDLIKVYRRANRK